MSDPLSSSLSSLQWPKHRKHHSYPHSNSFLLPVTITHINSSSQSSKLSISPCFSFHPLSFHSISLHFISSLLCSSMVWRETRMYTSCSFGSTTRSFPLSFIQSNSYLSTNKEEHRHNIFTITYGIENLIITILRTVLLLILSLHSQRCFMKESFTPPLLLPHSILSPINTQLDLTDHQLSSSQKTYRANTTSRTQACIPFQSPCPDSSYPLFSPTVVSPIPD